MIIDPLCKHYLCMNNNISLQLSNEKKKNPKLSKVIWSHNSFFTVSHEELVFPYKLPVSSSIVLQGKVNPWPSVQFKECTL